MRLFKIKEFARLTRAYHISDFQLCEAVARAEAGLIDVQLGKFLIKQRFAREGAGKSGGFRSILYFRDNDRAVFLHAFAKNERQNLTPDELEGFRSFAKEIAALANEAVANLLGDGRWIEISYEGYQKEISERADAVPAPRGGGSSRRRRHR
jgi:hypothetical protein